MKRIYGGGEMTREDAEQQSEHWQDIIDEKDALIEQQAKEIERLKAQLATANGEMIWATQRPTESGWYWMKDGSAMAVVQIEIGTFDGYHIEWVWQAGSRTQTPLSCCKDMQWAGPIHEPKELA